jgi:repressor LexA
MQVSDELLGNKPCYVLKVRGDSMIEAGILNGGYVVIEQRDSPNIGEIVAALTSRIRGQSTLVPPVRR